MNDFAYHSGYRKYSLNENYFENIDSEDKAYFLGFIFADGCVSLKDQNFLLRIEISKEDEAILYKFKQSIKSESPIKLSKNGKYVNIRLYSKKLIHDLIKLGCTERKSCTLKFPSLDRTVLHHFMRGYFDGDGTIRISKRKYDYSNRKIESEYKTFSFGITSSHEFVPEYQKQLCRYCDLNIVKLDIRENHSNLYYCGRTNLKKIFSFLYDGATIFLKRKFDRFKESEEYQKLPKMKDDEIRKILFLLQKFKICEVAKMYNVDRHKISKIKKIGLLKNDE